MPQSSWNIDKSIWGNVPEDILNGGWRKCQFIYSNEIYVKPLPGIYLIVTNSKILSNEPPFSGFQTPLYVGHSTILNKRFKQHTGGTYEGAIWKKLKDFHPNVVFWFKYCHGMPKEDLKDREQSLLDVFGGPLNKINSVAVQPSVIARYK